MKNLIKNSLIFIASFAISTTISAKVLKVDLNEGQQTTQNETKPKKTKVNYNKPLDMTISEAHLSKEIFEKHRKEIFIKKFGEEIK